MFNNLKKNAQPIISITTLIGPETVIHGDVAFGGGLHIDGKIEGSLHANDSSSAVLTISDKGVVNGEIQAPHVIVNGVVKGDITASERLELAGKARIEGNVYYKLLEMAAGAQINGKVVHQAEPRKQLPKPETLSVEQHIRVEQKA